MSDLKETLRAIKVQTIVTALMFVVIGILFIVFPDTSLKVLCYIAGGIMIFLGACKLVLYVVELAGEKKSTSLVSGVMLLVLGIVFVVNPGIIVGLFTLIFGVVMILDGIEKLQDAINGALAKSKFWWVDLIIACIVLVLGLVVLICNTSEWIMIFAGVAMIVEGVLDLGGAVFYSRKAKKEVKESNIEVIDV